MAELAINHTLNIITVECGKCGVIFGMTKTYNNARREDAETFYCLNGHPRGYVESASAKLQKELDVEKRRTEMERNRRAAAENDARAKLGQLTKLQNRIKKGVCPHCHRTFSQLARHMKTKHAEEHAHG